MYVCITDCTEGYDYSIIFKEDFMLFDGGIFDNSSLSINEVLQIILDDYFPDYHKCDLTPANYDYVMEKSEIAENEKLKNMRVVRDFKKKTDECFRCVGGRTARDVENEVQAYVHEKLYELNVRITGIAVVGSRCRGLEKNGSDIDVVVEYKGSESEDALFNVLNEDGFEIAGIRVDINPIKKDKTGTLAGYLERAEAYLSQKAGDLQCESEKDER